MYDRLLSLYQRGLIDEVALTMSVAKNWIKEAEKQKIMGSV